MHEWMGDNGHTPHVVVDAGIDGVSVPLEHVKDGKIILNISDTAAHNLKFNNDAISFRARFSGVPLVRGRVSALTICSIRIPREPLINSMSPC